MLAPLRAQSNALLLALPATEFQELQSQSEAVRRFFDRSRPTQATKQTLATRRVDSLMSTPALPCAVLCCAPEDSAQKVSILMRDTRVSALCITRDGALDGIVTNRDLTGKILAEARDPVAPD